ncbi:MAG: AtpZ/AtpI family protein [Myxococcales bacterium]|nr:MAG: AtpZ/AtpI family protein [Myxococcales bacterium]
MTDSESTNNELMGLAWSLGWRIAAGLLIGYWLDGRLGTAPWLTLGLTLAAFVAGVMQILRVVRQQNTPAP